MSNYKNLIIDGNNFLFRSFYSGKRPRIIDGMDTTPIYQTLNMLRNLMRQFSPEAVYFTWDKRTNVDFVNFRRELLTEYKDNRIETDDKKNVLSYMSIIVQFCDALGVHTIFPYDLEGDDVIKYLTDNLVDSLIISSDRDLLQLVDTYTHQLIPTKSIIVTPENFEEFTGVPQNGYLLYKAIMGDKSDNIAGIPKFGEVRAKGLTNKILNGETITDEYQTIIDTNLKIMDLSKALQYRPLEYDHYDKQMSDAVHDKYDSDKLSDLFREYSLDVFLREIGNWRSMFNKNAEFSWDDIMDVVVM